MRSQIIIELTRFQTVCLLLISFIVLNPVIAGTETLIQTSYYPSPQGGYATVFTTADTYLARDDGNVGVGRVNPAAKLDINGGIRIGNDSDACTPDKEGTLRVAGGKINVCTLQAWRTAGLSCYALGALSDAQGNAYAGCDAGWSITGGGNSSANLGLSAAYVSGAFGNGWWTDEDDPISWNQLQAYAVCCKQIWQ